MINMTTRLKLQIGKYGSTTRNHELLMLSKCKFKEVEGNHVVINQERSRRHGSFIL